MNIGLIIPSETYLFSPWEYNYYFTEVLRGVIAAADLFECNISIFPKGLKTYRGRLNLSGAIDISGVIIIAPVLREKVAEELKSLKESVILVNSRYSGLSHIDVNNKKAAAQAVEYLLESGHKKTAFINGKVETVNAEERLKGYKSAMGKKSKIVEDYIRCGDFSKDSGYIEMLELLKCESRPTAVFCANDLMALGAMKAINEKGLSVPQDVSIVGFDDLVISEYFTPPLTTVRQPLFHIGKEALIALTGIINGEKNEPQKIEIETRLIKRKSVARIT